MRKLPLSLVLLLTPIAWMFGCDRALPTDPAETTKTEMAASDGALFAKGGLPKNHTHDAGGITTGVFDVARLPVGTGSDQVASGDHTHTFNLSIQMPSQTVSVTAGGAVDIDVPCPVGTAAIGGGWHLTQLGYAMSSKPSPWTANAWAVKVLAVHGGQATAWAICLDTTP